MAGPRLFARPWLGRPRQRAGCAAEGGAGLLLAPEAVLLRASRLAGAARQGACDGSAGLQPQVSSPAASTTTKMELSECSAQGQQQACIQMQADQ